MNRFILIKINLLFACNIFFTAHAQKISNAYLHNNNFYAVWSMGSGALFSNINTGAVNISFPYTAENYNGTISNNVFTKTIHLFPNKTLASIYPISFEFGTRKHFFLSQISFLPVNNSSVNVFFGYGHNFYFNLFNRHWDSPKKKSFVLKPSLNVAFSQTGNGRNTTTTDNTFLGSIDNENKIIKILGFVSDSVFSVTRGSGTRGGSKRTYTYNTQLLSINFINRQWMIIPKIAVTNSQDTHMLHLELFFGYQISVSKKDGIGLMQSTFDYKGDKGLKHFIDIYKNNVQVTYDNSVISKSPFSLSGLYIGFTAGAAFSKRSFNSRHRILNQAK